MDTKKYITTYRNDLNRKSAAVCHNHAVISSKNFKWDHRLREKWFVNYVRKYIYYFIINYYIIDYFAKYY